MTRGRTRIRVLSWNVNGIRSAARKGLGAWLDSEGADVVALQEVRALPAELPAFLRNGGGWHVQLAAAERRGYSGVALLSRRPPDRVWAGIGEEVFDREGRVIGARFGRLAVLSVYVPKGSGAARDNSRVPYKLSFSRALFRFVQRLRRAGLRIVVTGDFNTAHQAIDLARPRANEGNSGFLPEEREEFGRWIEAGWVDAFRRFHPEPGQYTWWSQRRGVRERNIGWRIDYALVSPNLLPFLADAFHQPEVVGSDHCPVGIELDARALG